jgi:hypothetical protein
MLKLFIGTLFLLMAIVASSQDCRTIKTGKFQTLDERNGTTKILRTPFLQREENQKFGIITEDSIKWINDCVFQLVPWRVLQNDSKIDLTKDLQLQIEILEVNSNTYKQRTTSKLTGQARESLIKIVR